MFCEQRTLSAITSSYVTDKQKRKYLELEKDPKRIKTYLRALYSDSTAQNGSKDSSKPHDSFTSNQPKVSKRRLECLNEFTDNEKIIASSFFHIFLLGKAYMTSGSLSNKHRRHIFLQYTRMAGSCQQFIFFLFDQLQRHSNVLGINAVVRSHKQSFDRFTKLVKKKDFRKKIIKAKKNPSGKTARQIMHTVGPVLTMGGKNTLVGSNEKNDTIAKIHSLCLRYGMPTLFLTVAIDDVNNFNS